MFNKNIYFIVLLLISQFWINQDIFVESKSHIDKVILISNVNSPPIVIYRKGTRRRPGKLIVINVLSVVNGNQNQNDVHFDFNKYFKVNIATNRPTVLPVTLYNPHLWPGPNDTHPTTTTTPAPTTPKKRFAFGLRRSVIEYRNSGYGYDHNDSQHITNPPIIQTTISPYNRKFYTINPNVLETNTTIREFRGYRNLPGNFHISRNYTDRLPRFKSPGNVAQTIRNVTRKTYQIYRTTTRKPTQWHIFEQDQPRFNFSRDLGDFQDIVNNDFHKWKNFTGSVNQFKPDDPIANTSFRCNQMSYFGYYADIESNCKIFHICTPDGRKASFVCPKRLLFNQMLSVCDWRRNVVCQQSYQFYDINLIKFDHWNKPLLSSRK